MGRKRRNRNSRNDKISKPVEKDRRQKRKHEKKKKRRNEGEKLISEEGEQEKSGDEQHRRGTRMLETVGGSRQGRRK